MLKLATPIFVAALSVGAYLAGVFDRPEFQFQDSLLVTDGRSGDELYAIVAATTEKDIGKHVERLFKGTVNSIKAAPGGAESMKRGAELHGGPEGTTELAIGLYFDDPAKKDHPRWALGWAVEANSFDEVQKIAAAAADGPDKLLEEGEPIRAVRISQQQPVLKARIPWRSFLTPMIAPMIHWKRGFDQYEKDGHKSNAGKRSGEDGSIAMEIYVHGPNNAYKYIDYVVLMGDTSKTWDDTFPLDEGPETTEKEDTEAVEEEAATEQQGDDEDDAKDDDDVAAQLREMIPPGETDGEEKEGGGDTEEHDEGDEEEGEWSEDLDEDEDPEWADDDDDEVDDDDDEEEDDDDDDDDEDDGGEARETKPQRLGPEFHEVEDVEAELKELFPGEDDEEEDDDDDEEEEGAGEGDF